MFYNLKSYSQDLIKYKMIWNLLL